MPVGLGDGAKAIDLVLVAWKVALIRDDNLGAAGELLGVCRKLGIDGLVVLHDVASLVPAGDVHDV